MLLSLSSMTPTYILHDPQHEYTKRFMDAFRLNHNLRPVCLYVSRKHELYHRDAYPDLQTDHVLEHYFLDEWSPPALAAALRERYDVRAVVPTCETAVAPCAALLAWLPEAAVNSAETLARFRDKQALKEHIRRTHPEVPMNASRGIDNIDDVYAQALPERFILKPNSGYGSRHIGFFTKDTLRHDIEGYLGRSAAQHYVLEDYLQGPEFAVNGQIDHAGNSTALSVVRYEHRQVNGKPNVYDRSHHVRENSQEFSQLASYAQMVMRATGLVRSPFHLEAILTSDGPRLVEVGARFGGAHVAQATEVVHGGVLDVFALAAHYYVEDTAFPRPYVDWAHYNRVSFLQLDGISTRAERIYNVQGVDRVEAMPEFHSWAVKPAVGTLLQPTVDLFGAPYSVQLFCEGPQSHLEQAAAQIQGVLRFNEDVSARQRITTELRSQLRTAQKRGQWLLQRLA